MDGWPKTWICLAAGLLCLAAASADARPARRPSIITQPDWVARPDADDLTEHYPDVAAALSLTGRAVVTCEVDAFGGLEGCVAAEESPAGLGFGQAALAMTPLFRMRPMTRDGEPVAHGKVSIPIAFRLPPAPPPPADTPAAEDPQMLALAQRLLAAMNVRFELRRVVEQQIAALEFGEDGVTPEDARPAAAAALRRALDAELDAAVTAQARALTRIYTGAELAGVVAFMESPAGAVMRPNRDLAALDAMLSRDSGRNARIAAREAFCRTNSCDIAPVLRAEVEATLKGATFSKGPELDEVSRATPILLRALSLPGAAQLVCRVDDLATPADCKVAAEAPAGLGVGGAAIRLTPRMRVHPILMSQGAQHETVAVLVVFPPPDEPEPFTPPQPRSPRALALAEELTGQASPAEAAARNEAALSEIVRSAGSDAEPEVVAAALAAMRQGWLATQPASIAGFMAARAALFSEDQLQAALAFRRSPAGRAMQAKGGTIAETMTPLMEAMMVRVTARAREAYCKDQPCAAAVTSGP